MIINLKLNKMSKKEQLKRIEAKLDLLLESQGLGNQFQKLGDSIPGGGIPIPPKKDDEEEDDD